MGIQKHPLTDCDNCPWQNTKGSVAGKGPDDAELVIIGEAPGKTEVMKGEPFIGPSGKLLDMVLAHHQIDRNKVFLTNAVICHPPYTGGAKSVAPPKEAIKACWPRLKAEINGHPTRTVVTLGNTSSKVVLDTREGITKLRSGPPKSSRSFPEVRVIPTVHPAACLRSGDMFPSLVNDIGKIKATTETWEEPKYTVYDTPTEALQAISQLQQYERLVVDIEVGVDKDASFSHPDQLLCVGVGYRRGAAVVFGEKACQDARVISALGKCLQKAELICQNGKFDIQALMRMGLLYYNPDDVKDSLHRGARLWFDTMLASYSLDERPGIHSLEYLATEFVGSPNWKNELDKYKGPKDSYAVIPRDVLYKYNAWDAANTWYVYEFLEQRLEDAGMRGVHDHLVNVSNHLMYAELEGIKIDESYNDELAVEYTGVLEGLEAQLRPWVANPRSWQQVQQALLAMGIKVASTNVESLNAVLEAASKRLGYEDVVKFVSLLLQQRKVQKSYGTYVKGIRKRMVDGRVYSTFLIHGTVTGRLSSRNPNLQNITRGEKLRRQFVPEEGNIFVQADYRQAELRVIATEARDPYLQEILNDESRDIHGEVAEQFYGPKWTKEQRVRAKAVVFGLAYGREAYSLAVEFGISEQEAQAYLDAFFARIPNTVQWRADIRRRVLGDSHGLQSHFGRKRRFWLITKENKKDVVKEGLSFIPQVNVNDICLTAMGRLLEEGIHVRIPVHDSLLAECAIEEKEEVASTMKRLMEQTAIDVYTDFVTFPVDVEYGRSWGELSAT